MSSATGAAQAPPLTRESLARRTGVPVPTPGVRIVHLGLGAFHRAHQAWYTAQVDETREWGIAAFTGRNPTAARELIPQDGLYTLVERSEQGDVATIITSIVEAVSGTDLDRLVSLLAAPATAIVTTTITEAGYRLTSDGQPNLGDPAVVSDAAWLKATFAEATLPESLSDGPTTSLARLLLGLEARRRAGAGRIAVVPCDNMPDNGAFVAAGITAMARAASSTTAEWIAENVSFVSTSVDRITPRTTPTDLVTATELTGWQDNAAVVTEPFSDWVLSGDFPAGRPAWEKAGARFVEDIEPFERRKLWLLNGAHSLLAYAGLLRDHQTVAAAMQDPVCRGWVDDFWNEAVRHLPAEILDLDAYRAALLNRFDNTRIEHKLAQISSEGVTKLRVRVTPTVLAERAAGRSGDAGIRAIGSWVALALSGHELVDGESDAIAAALAQPREQAIDALVTLVDARLTADADVLAGIRAVVAEHADA